VKASAIIQRVNKALSRVNVTNRIAYKRIILRSGGDPLIGRYSSVKTGEWKLDPQPLVMTPRADEPLAVNSDGQSVVLLGDLLLTVTPTALSREDLRDKNLVLVFKHPSTSEEEEYFIVSYRPVVVYGEDVMYHVLARSKRRPE
jgi:hypothetical protein